MGAVAKLRAERRSKLLRFRLPITHREAGLGSLGGREARQVGGSSKIAVAGFAQFGMHARRLVRADSRLWKRLPREHGLVGIQGLRWSVQCVDVSVVWRV